MNEHLRTFIRGLTLLPCSCEIMKLLMGVLFLGTLLFSDTIFGQEQIMFLDKYRIAIQNYIMTGHENELQHCDILSGTTISHKVVPQISMGLDKINTLDMKSAFASSHCLLVNYHVSSESNLSALLDFAWTAIQYVRLALVMKMGSSVSLAMASNTTNLPFLIAAKQDDNTEQFICPVLGEEKPRLEQDMCKPSYASYKHKTLRIALTGIEPDFVSTSTGNDGTDMRLLMLLSKILDFRPKITVPKSFMGAVEMVCS